MALPKGTRIDCLAHFDNSSDNPYNPDPTKLVKWGEQTWEEMMIGYVDVDDAAAGPPAADRPERHQACQGDRRPAQRRRTPEAGSVSRAPEGAGSELGAKSEAERKQSAPRPAAATAGPWRRRVEKGWGGGV